MINDLLNHPWAIIVLISSVLIAIGTFRSVIKQSNAEKKASEAQQKVLSLTEKNAKLNEDIVKLQGEALDETHYLLGMVTGG